MVGSLLLRYAGANRTSVYVVRSPAWILTLAPIACEDKVLLVSPAIGIRDFAPTCDYIFNLWPVDFESSKGLGKLVVTKGYNHIAIVGSDQSWEYEQAQAVKAGIEGEKGLVSIYLIVNNKAEDFTTEATKVIHSGADVVILNNYGYMGMFAQKLRELGFKGDFYSVLIDESRKDQVKGALEGAIAVTGFTPTEEFINKYESKYGKKPDFPADTSYDAMILVADAIQESGSVQPDVLVTTLSQRKSMNGASGDLTFTVEGDTLKTPKYQVVENDKLVDYQP